MDNYLIYPVVPNPKKLLLFGFATIYPIVETYPEELYVTNELEEVKL